MAGQPILKDSSGHPDQEEPRAFKLLNLISKTPYIRARSCNALRSLLGCTVTGSFYIITIIISLWHVVLQAYYGTKTEANTCDVYLYAYMYMSMSMYMYMYMYMYVCIELRSPWACARARSGGCCPPASA